MALNMYLMSICIPTYNGQETLRETLDSLIVERKNHQVEIIINDDKSTDETFIIAKEYAEKFPFISIYQNKKNLRMDRNFTTTAVKAQGKYVWLCGQDDILQRGAIDKAIEIIKEHDEVNFIYFNYKFVDDTLQYEVMPPKLSIQNDMYFEDHINYFQKIKLAPTFLPATIMKKHFWDNPIYEDYFDTYYVQVGVWLEYSKNADVFVVADPNYVLCRVPAESWKYKDGQMLYETEIGKLRVYRTALNHAKINESVFNYIKKLYLKSAFLNILASKSKGLSITQKNLNDIRFVFHGSKYEYAYAIAIVSIPSWLAKPLYFFGQNLRKLYRSVNG